MTTQDLLQKAYADRNEQFRKDVASWVNLTNREIPQHILDEATFHINELNAVNKYLADNPALRTLLDLVLAEITTPKKETTTHQEKQS